MTRRIAAQIAACLVGAAACVAVMAFDGEGWHDSTTSLNDAAGLIGFVALVVLAMASVGTLWRHAAHRRRLRRRVGRMALERRAARVDVNQAPRRMLAKLPCIDDALAGCIAELRPFASVEDLGAVLGLPAHIVEELRPVTAFEARECR